eukprot:scaffold247814_cov33-Prasinocladus_malaysianus.AAC.2
MIPEMAALHFVGGKPWQDPPRDWEDNAPYALLFDLWRKVRRQELDEAATRLTHLIPKAPV